MLKKQRDFLRLRHAKEHGNGIRKNPFFFRAPPKKWLIAMGALFITGSVLGGIVGVTHLPYFTISAVAVQGATVIHTEDIEHGVRNSIDTHHYPLVAKENIFLLRTHAIEKELLTQFALESVIIERKGRTLNVTVKEKVTNLALRTKEKTVFLDLSGEYIRDATAEESRAIDIRIGTAPLAEGEVVVPLHAEMSIVLNTQTDSTTSLPRKSVEHILALTSLLRQQGIGVKTCTFDGTNALFTRLDTDQPYDLYFDFNRPAAEQMSTLTAIITSPTFTQPAEYIDLRFGAYVYLK